MPDAVSPATSDPTIPGASVLARRGEGLGAGRFEARFEERSREDERVDLLLGRPDGTDRDRLIRWARALAAVSHPSLPAIVRIDDETESGYVAFEHIDGPTLAERLSHHDDGLPEVEALAVTLQTASVLEACHQQGLAHGAIDAEVIILAERAGGLDEVFLTGWTPPRDEEDFIVRLREDIRALGGVLYQTLTGLAAPSTQPSEVEDLEGDGGRFDGVLLDWVEVGRDLRGMGEPALQALSESESMDDVGAFARALLPHFRDRMSETIDDVGRTLDAERSFMSEVERQRKRLRELENQERFVRGWLMERAGQIAEREALEGELTARVSGLQTLETEIAIMVGTEIGVPATAQRAPRPSPDFDLLPGMDPDERPIAPLIDEPGTSTSEQGDVEPILSNIERPTPPASTDRSVNAEAHTDAEPSEDDAATSTNESGEPQPASAEEAVACDAVSTNEAADLESAAEVVQTPAGEAAADAVALDPETQSHPISNDSADPKLSQSSPKEAATSAASEADRPAVPSLPPAPVEETSALENEHEEVSSTTTDTKAPEADGETDVETATEEPPHSAADEIVDVAANSVVEEASDVDAMLEDDEWVMPPVTNRRLLVGFFLAVLLGVGSAALLLYDPHPPLPRTVMPSETAKPAPVLPPKSPPESAGGPEVTQAVVPHVEPVPKEVEPVRAPPLAPPPKGMVAVTAGTVNLGLSAEQRAMVMTQCRLELAKYPAAICETLITDIESRAQELPGFYLDRFEVSQDAFDACVSAGGCRRRAPLRWEDGRQPATGMTRDAAANYCRWKKKRLPTTAEWTRAARGHDGRLYPWGNEAVNAGDTHRASYGRFTRKNGAPTRADRHKYSGPVRIFRDVLSPFGAANLVGNVAEWTLSDATDKGVLVGGGWRSAPFQLRVTRTERVAPTVSRDDVGFRCALDGRKN